MKLYKYTKIIITLFKWKFWDLIWFLKLLFQKKGSKITNHEYSIGITTFIFRYKLYFKHTIKRLSRLFYNTEIIVLVNGHFDEQEQRDYLDDISGFCSDFPNIKLITYIEAQGLSKLWNQIIINSSNEKILILNDDLTISPFLRRQIEKSKIINELIAVINNSWSHYLISKQIIKQVGWFDERFTEIGGEDDDYLARLAHLNIQAKDFNIKGLKNFSHKLKVNSFGKDMTGEFSYSKVNTEILLKKWEIKTESFPGSIYSRGKYWKFKDGMESPDYYSDYE